MQEIFLVSYVHLPNKSQPLNYVSLKILSKIENVDFVACKVTARKYEMCTSNTREEGQ